MTRTWLTMCGLALCVATGAWAQVPSGFVDVQGLGLARSSTEVVGPLEVSAAGPSLGGRVSAEWYAAPTGLGVLLSVVGDRTVVSGQDFSGQSLLAPTLDLRGRLGLAGRLTLGHWVFDGALGYGAARSNRFVAPAGVLGVSELWSHGPFASAGAGLDLGFVNARVGGVAQPIQWTAEPDAAWRGGHYAVSAEVAAGGWPVGAQLRLSAVARYEFSTDGLGATAAQLHDQRHTVGVGLRLGLMPPPPAPLFGSVAGEVLRSDGAPALKASVQLQGGAPHPVDAQGHFSFEGLAVGPITLEASEGPRRAELVAVVRGGELASVQLKLPAPSGPGTVRGVVGVALAAPAQGIRPLKGAKVALTDGRSALTDEKGAFVLESVGPGPVPLAVTLSGYRPGAEVVMVPAEGEASAEVQLVPERTVAPAVIRGLVRLRSKGGQVHVSLKGSDLRVAVAPDGRFKASVPPGTYEILFEAEGYVTQTKRVSLRETEQVIFNIDLYPQR